MNSRNTIADELNALESTLSDGLNSEVYAVPNGYFEGFATSVLARIKAENADSAAGEIETLSPLLAGLSRKMPFDLPQQYFEENSESLASVAVEEEESLVLSFISKEIPYQAPLGYFAGFPEQMLQKIARPQGRVVPMFKRKWMKMAVAASFAGIVAVSGFFYFNRSTNAVAPKDAVATELKNTSTQELNEFLKTTDVANNNTTVVSTSLSGSKEISRPLFKDISDKELEAFLNEIPADELMNADEETDLLN